MAREQKNSSKSMRSKVTVGILALSSIAFTGYYISQKNSNANLVAASSPLNSSIELSKRSPATADPKDCTPGMQKIKEDKISWHGDGTPGWENCPENCETNDEFPGYDSKRPASFSRDQDSVAMCGPFALADYLGHELKSGNLWPKTANYSMGVSAFDLEIQAYKRDRKHTDPNTIKNFLGPNAKEEGKWRNSTEQKAEEFIEIAQKQGVCPENAFPSEFRGDGNMGSIRSVYEALQKHLKDAKNKTQAGVDLPGLCPECSVLESGFSASQWNQVQDVLRRVSNLDQDDFEVLEKIDEIACAGKRIKYPESWTLRHTDFRELGEHLSIPKSVAILNVHAAPLDPTHIKPNLGQDIYFDSHYVLVFGTTVQRVNNKLVCYYAIKNSWGPSSCVETWGNNRTEDIQCIPEDGTYLVSAKTLKSMAIEAFK